MSLGITIKMRRFKLRKGNSQVYDITADTYESLTSNQPPYVQTGKDENKRYFGICPACDNPIQIIGLYKSEGSTTKPYGRHYNRDTPLANHNEIAYRFCPYASHTYASMTKEALKNEATEYEIGIYNTMREHFDQAVYLAEQSIGVKISPTYAERLLKNYLASQGHMYYFATRYNLPWMLFYFSEAQDCFGKMVRKDSPLYSLAEQIPDVRLEQYKDSKWYIIKNQGNFLNLYFSLILHKRKVVDDEVIETFELRLSTKGKDGLPKKLCGTTVEVNEYRFPNLVVSTEAQKYRTNPGNQALLQIAERVMPELS